LSKDVRGDLDWIVMKALEKDRNRRYETASNFAADIERHLHDDPVEAGPPSAVYRMRKFALRNKAALFAASALATVVFLGLIGTTCQAVRATHAERVARDESDRAGQEAERAKSEAAIAEAVNEFLNRDLLAQAHPYVPYDRYKQSKGELKLDTVLDRAAENLDGRFPDQPLVEAALRETIGTTFNLLGHPDRAKAHLQRAVELRRIHLGEEHPMTLKSMAELGIVTDDPSLCARVLEIRRRVLGKDHLDTLHSMFYLAMVLREKGEIARAIALLRDCEEAERKTLGEDDAITAYTMHCLASTLMVNAGKPGIPPVNDGELESMFRHALEVTRKKHGDSWHTYNVTHGLAQFLSSRGRYDEAESLLESAISRLESLPGASPEMSAGLTGELLAEYRARGEAKKATETEHTQPDVETMRSRVARLLREHPDSPTLLTSNAHLLFQLHRYAEAEAGFRAAASIKPNDPWLLQAIGDSCAAQRRFAEAEVAFREAIRMEPNESGRHHNLGDALKNLGKSDEAAAEYAEAERLQTSTEKKPTTTPKIDAK
jgi:Flp pilus assembly protein TadD